MAIDRKAFHSLSSGLYVISSVDRDGRACGCVANTLLQVASDPAQLLVSINKQNATANAISDSQRFCASVLAQDTTMELIGTFGFKSSVDVDKFEGVGSATCDAGIPYLTQNALATFEVRVDSMIDVGTHIVFIGTVENADVLEAGPSLTYDYYHRILRGKTPAKAATYNDGEANVDDVTIVEGELEQGADAVIVEKVGWRCKICGFTVEGYEDGLPEDWRCPMCGMGRDCFEKVYL